jgi:thiol:disulfide interchange protein DsbC
MQTLNNVTIYTFLYPILSADSMDKSKAIWCSKDRAVAWDNHMLNGKTAAAPAGECKDPLEQNLAFGKNLGISGTPTLIFADGTRTAGAMPVAAIEQRLATAKR